MCRFLVYYSLAHRSALMADVVVWPEHSIIKQAYESKERFEKSDMPLQLNADGFGVGWYTPDVDYTPCVFTSTLPAWNNRNLLRLSQKVISPIMFAHVRAASPGSPVTDANCHPFSFGRYMFMHNGGLSEFNKIKRFLINELREDIYQIIEGSTDSEHAFALFLNELPPHVVPDPTHHPSMFPAAPTAAASANTCGTAATTTASAGAVTAVSSSPSSAPSLIDIPTDAEGASDHSGCSVAAHSPHLLSVRAGTAALPSPVAGSGPALLSGKLKVPLISASPAHTPQGTARLNTTDDTSVAVASHEVMLNAVLNTIKRIRELRKKAGITTPSHSSLNFAVSDGESVVVTRFIDNDAMEPATMYFSAGTEFRRVHDSVYRMSRRNRREEVVIVASERLTNVKEDWVEVPRNTAVVITKKLNVLLKPIELD